MLVGFVISCLVGFAVYCAAQMVCGVQWTSTLKGFPPFCLLLLTVIALRAMELAGSKAGEGTNEQNRASAPARAPRRLSDLGDEDAGDVATVEAIAVTSSGIDLTLHRPLSRATVASTVTVAGSACYEPGGWESFCDATFAAGMTDLDVTVPDSVLVLHGISSCGFFSFAAAGDSDGDGLEDWFELLNSRTSADNPDSDGDGISDGTELEQGTLPRERDTDGDGLDDGAELVYVEEGVSLPQTTTAVTPVSSVNGVYTIPLPFTMNFGGVSSDTVLVSEKGVVSFPACDAESAALVSDGQNVALDTPVFPETSAATVAVYWDDLWPAMSNMPLSGVNVGTRTADGVTTFVLLFHSLGIFGVTSEMSVSDRLQARVVLASDEPSTVYVSYDYCGPSFDASCATIGAQGPRRRATLPLSFNTPCEDLEGTVLAYRFGLGTNPRLADTDGDGLCDGDEHMRQLDPLNPDSDGDGMPDGWELQYGLDPRDPSDAAADAEEDGVSNLDEYLNGSRPDLSDTDEDGISDADEIAQGTDPADGGDTIPVKWVTVTGDLSANETKTTQEVVVIPAGTSAYVGVFVQSEEYPQWTRIESEWNDVLTWSVGAEGQPSLSGGVLVNDEEVSWENAAAEAWSVDGFVPVAHMGGAVYCAGSSDLEISVDLTATNIRDANLPSSVIVGVFPLQLVQMNMPRETGVGGTTDAAAGYRRSFIRKDGVAYITGEPNPPSLVARFKDLPSWLDVSWSMTLATERANRRFDGIDDRTLPEVVLRGSADYFITAELRNELVGGACALSVQVGESNCVTYPFFVRGKNPLDATAEAYVTANVDEEFRPYAWMIARHESKNQTRLYNQFNAPDNLLKELPNWGAPHGWGLAQIDKGSNGVETAVLYDWHANVREMNEVLRRKLARYREIVRCYRAAYANDPIAGWSEPDSVTITVEGVVLSAQQWAVMTLYNGSSGCHEYPFNAKEHTPIHYNPVTHAWELYTNVNDYVPSVIRDRNCTRDE